MSRSVPPPPILDSEAPPSLRAPFMETRFVAGVDGTRLHVRSTRAVPARPWRAYFCDGIGCDGFIWKYLFERVQPFCELTHWHYRGHGRSAFPSDSERCSIEDNADDLNLIRADEQRLDQQREPRSSEEPIGAPTDILFGHSMGVQVVLEAYRRAPERVRAMVLLCGSYGKVTHTFRNVPILEAVLPVATRFVEKYPELIRAVWSRVPHELALKAALKMGDFDSRNFNLENVLPYMEHMSNVDIPFFLRMLGSAGEHSAESYLGEITAPVLVISGENDTFTPAWLSREMAERIMHSEHLQIKGGSHVAPVEQPEAVGAKISAFLQQL